MDPSAIPKSMKKELVPYRSLLPLLAFIARTTHDLATAVDAQLRQDVAHVALDGEDAELERGGDLLVRGARGDQSGHLLLASRELGGGCRGHPR